MNQSPSDKQSGFFVRSDEKNRGTYFNQLKHSFSEERLNKIMSTLSKLEQDLPRTFPDLPDFHN